MCLGVLVRAVGNRNLSGGEQHGDQGGHAARLSKARAGTEARRMLPARRMALEEATVSSMWEIATALKVPVAELCNDKAV